MRSRELDTCVDGEVVVQETRVQANIPTEAVHLIRLEDTLLMVEARRDTIGELASSTTHADVIVTSVGQLIDLTLPVGAGRAKITDRGGRDTLDKCSVFVSREDVHVASGL